MEDGGSEVYWLAVAGAIRGANVGSVPFSFCFESLPETN